MSGYTAKWEVPLNDGKTHIIEFEHGTATGKRVVKVNGETLVNREWMFRLVGDEIIHLGKNKIVIRIDPINGLKYSYTLWVNGKSYENFIQTQSKLLKCWTANLRGVQYRIVLDKNTQTIWINGIHEEDVKNDFVDGGAEMEFSIGGLPAVIRSNNIEGREITYILYVDDLEIKDQDISE